MVPLLEITDLHTFYDDSHILRGLSLSLQPGVVLGLMGRNGMGKTTLLRAIMGLVPARSGTMSFAGTSILGVATHHIAQSGLAYVPEGRGIFASLSVAENLAVAARVGPQGQQDWTIDRVLALFPRLKQRYRNGGDQLSGGEQQMLAIARALLGNPRLLLLDEATEGLAPLIRQEIWRIVRVIRESGITTVVVDKTIAEVAAISDRVAVLVKGAIVFDGAPQALLADQETLHRHLGV